MKRFYNNTIMSGAFSKALRVLALLCVLLGFSGSAWGAENIYVTGDAFDGWGNWTQMTSIGDNKYTCVIKNSSGKFKLSSSKGYGNTWNNLSCGDGSVTCNGANDHQINKAGVLYFEWKDNGYVWVEENSSSDCDPSADIYLTGSFNSWNTAQANYKLTANPGNDAEVMIKGVTLSANAEFKVFQGCFYGYENLVQTDDNKGFVANTDGNIKVTKAGTYDVYFDKNDHHIYIGLNVPCTEDDSNLGECDRIEVYCRYTENDDCNMKIYAYSSCTSKILNSNGTAGNSGEKVNVNGTNYAKWVFPTTGSNICVKFISGTDASYATTVRCNLSSGYKYYFTLPSGWGNQSFDPTSEKISCGGSGDDDDDDDTADCDGNNIEIWCRGVGAYTDMWCYGWNPDNDSQKPFGGFAGRQCNGDKRTYNGHQWAVWTAENYNKLSVIFSNGSSACQTNDVVGLTKGNRYFFVLSDNWNKTLPSMSAIPCGGSGEIVIVNGTVYLDISKLQGWDDAGAVLKVRITDNSDNTEELALTQCPSDANIFYVDQLLNLENIKKVNMLRYDDKGATLWNQTGDITFNTNTPCVQLTGWNGHYAHYSLTTYKGACGVQGDSPVLLTKDAVVSDDGERVTMYAYLSKTFCEAITEYGFVYCQGSATQGCTPTRSSAKLKVNNGQLYRGESFELTTSDSDLPNGSTYGYKAYVMVGNMMYISDETGYFRLADCTTRPEAGGDPINITVNAALGEDFIDDCSLTYGSLETAIEKLRDSYNNEDPYKYVTYFNSQSYNLNQPVNILVHYYDDTPTDNTSAYLYRGTTNVGKYAGNNKPKNANLLENFNRTEANAANILTIKAGTKIAKPLIHHIVLRNSKNIVLDSLYIYSDPNGVGDNAIEMDINVASGTDGWHTLNKQTGPGITENYLDNANILIKNCVIESNGFTGIHISSYNGVTFKNNDFESKFESGSDNDINYGASAKFLYCKNIKFIENNFRGDHATLMWIQEVKNMLVMNNVFWNTNKYQQKQGTHVPAAMRIVTQWNPTQNIGFYYNTYFFADNGNNWSASKYNFLHFSHTVSGGSGSYNLNTMYFKYNNCYSYDPDCPGDEDIDLGGNTNNFCPNNFWSEYDRIKGNAKSVFAFGCDGNRFENVKGQVCATTAEGPSSLMIKGTDMNLGSAPTKDELLGFTLTEDEAKGDRYYSNVRPDGVGWTYGAYQSKSVETTDVIYWVGHTDDWDDRNNWEYLTREDPNDPNSPMIRRTVSCLNDFSEDLKVIIEEIGTREIVGGRKWPLIPSSFDETTRTNNSKAKVPAGEQVNTTNKFAKTIELEYGAGIKGVENLGDRTYYDNATVGFMANRNQWILVGTVIKPYDETLRKYRNLKSGDYFVKDHLPHVYMHKAKLDGVNAKWEETFSSLEVEVEPTTVFAIQAPDQYGKYKLPAAYYNPLYHTNYDPNEPITYKNFDGKFVNDTGLPNYTDLTAGQPALLNNSYPACIDAKALEIATGGTVQYYNYESGTFMNTSATSQDVLLKPQHGFIFTPAVGETSLQIPSSVIVDGNTRSRSAEMELPTFSLNLYNANVSGAYSNVVVRCDELMDSETPSPTDVEKVFSPNTDSPELYIIANDLKKSRLTVGPNTKVIPLGIRIKKDMNVKFEKVYFNGFNNVILEDTYTGKQYDLLRNSHTTEVLIAGDIEGRYFLHLEEYVEKDIPEDDTPTKVEENEVFDNAINIYVDESNIIHVVTNSVELQSIYVSDITGKNMKYNVKGYSAELNLPVAKGVYTINVIGETASRTEKVILK